MNTKCKIWKTNPTKADRKNVVTCNCDGCVSLLAVEIYEGSNKHWHECVLAAKTQLDLEVLEQCKKRKGK